MRYSLLWGRIREGSTMRKGQAAMGKVGGGANPVGAPTRERAYVHGGHTRVPERQPAHVPGSFVKDGARVADRGP